jgi:photosystem II stability/assembly factor-like uncharacterized protein
MTWIPLGPSCILDEDNNKRMPRTGSCTAIAFDPKTAGTVYVGAANGGLWKTTDAGVNWAPLLDRQATLSVGAVAIAKNSGHIFVGTGDPNPTSREITKGPHAVEGRGVMTSKDAGVSWTLNQGALTSGSPTFELPPITMNALVRQFEGARSFGIVVYRTAGDQPEKRLVLASTRGLYESLDGGDLWTRLVPPSGRRTLDATSVVVDDTDIANPHLYAPLRTPSLADHQRIYRRTGSGPLLELPEPFDGDAARVALALSPVALMAERGMARILYAAAASETPGRLAGVAMSTDAGNSWTDITENLQQLMSADKGNHSLTQHLTLAVDPDEPQTLYCGGVHLYRRRQGQTLWKRIGKTENDRVHVGQHAVVFDPHAATPVMWLANNGGIYVSHDRGDTWGHRNRGLVTMQVYSVSSYPKGSIALSGTQHNAGQRFIGHPVWWKTTGAWGENRGSANSAFDTAIDPKRPEHWYIGFNSGVGTHGVVSLSHNAGRSFRDISPIAPSKAEEYAAFYRRFVIDPYTPNRSEADVWLGDIGDVQLRQREHPEDGWWQVYTPFISTTDARGISAMGFAVRPAGDSGPLKTLHLGMPRNPNSGGGYVRYDLGLSEETSIHDFEDPLNTGVAPSISSVAADRDDRTVYAAYGPFRRERSEEPDTFGLQRSDSGGIAPNATTSPFDLTNVFDGVQVVALDPAKPERVLVGTDDRLWRSEDKGEHWERWMDGLPFAMVTGIDIQAAARPGSPRLVRIATYGRGVWERDIDAADRIDPELAPDIFLRHHAGFTRRPEPPRPATVPKHEKHFWEEHADLRFDTKRRTKGYRKPKSTLDYQGDGPLDHIGFEMMRRDRKIHAGSDARVFLQIHNRGPAVARYVTAWMLWAPLERDAAPELPFGFWDLLGGVGDIDDSVWKQVGDPVLIDEIRPADPRIARWEWTVPETAPKRIALLAVVSEHDDLARRPLDDPFDPVALARLNKRFMLSTARVRTIKQSTSWSASDILGALAVAVVAGVVIYGTAQALSDSPPTSPF